MNRLRQDYIKTDTNATFCNWIAVKFFGVKNIKILNRVNNIFVVSFNNKIYLFIFKLNIFEKNLF